MGGSACGGCNQCCPDVYWRHCKRRWLTNYDVRHTRPDCRGHLWRYSLLQFWHYMGDIRSFDAVWRCLWRRRRRCTSLNRCRDGWIRADRQFCRRADVSASQPYVGRYGNPTYRQRRHQLNRHRHRWRRRVRHRHCSRLHRCGHCRTNLNFSRSQRACLGQS